MNSINVPRQDDKAQDALPPSTLKLSILVPVYNVEDYVSECIQSIVSQAASIDIEIILLDDCSTDGSRQICLNFAKQYPDQIRVMTSEKNSGLSSARNSMLEEATGNYIWFVDSDDYLLPGSIASLTKILRQHQPDLVLCDYRKRRFLTKKCFSGAGRKLEFDIANLVGHSFKYRRLYAWNRISRRSMWADDLRFPHGKVFEDMATTPTLMLRAKSYYYAPEGWLFYRTRPGSIMSSVRTRNFFDVRKHDDMADGMRDLKTLMRKYLPARTPQTEFYVSHFVANQFAKLAQRLKTAENDPTSASGEHPATLQSYYEKMQASSPIAFEEMLSLYFKRLRFYSFFILSRALRQLRNEAIDAK